MRHAILQADLEHLNLGSLLQLSEVEFFSGHIVVDVTGHIDLCNGQSIAAGTNNGLRGRQAIQELFLATTGAVRIELNPRVTGEAIAPTISLVMEGCQLLDEWTEVADRRLALASDRDPRDERERIALKALAPLLAYLEGAATLADAVLAAKIPKITIIDPVRALLEAGILIEAPPLLPRMAVMKAPPADTADPFGEPDELFIRGRLAFRDGELQLAEQLWVQALSVQPNDRVLAQNLRLVRQRIAAQS